MPTSTKQVLNQDCAETMITEASRIFLNKKIAFNYKGTVRNTQIDLGAVFIDGAESIWTNGTSKTNIEQNLKQLDKRNLYFMRAGINGTTGHFDLLYFNESINGWFAYSTPTANIALTNNANDLTLNGEGKLVSLGTLNPWGTQYGERSITLSEVTEKKLILAANLTYDTRMASSEDQETAAVFKCLLAKEQPNISFYPALVTQKASLSDTDYTFLFKCLASIAAAAGAMLLLIFFNVNPLALVITGTSIGLAAITYGLFAQRSSNNAQQWQEEHEPLSQMSS